MAPWYPLAVFHCHKDYFSATIEPTYIGGAHRFDDVPEMTPGQKEAMQFSQSLSEELGSTPVSIAAICSSATTA